MRPPGDASAKPTQSALALFTRWTAFDTRFNLTPKTDKFAYSLQRCTKYYWINALSPQWSMGHIPLVYIQFCVCPDTSIFLQLKATVHVSPNLYSRFSYIVIILWSFVMSIWSQYFCSTCVQPGLFHIKCICQWTQHYIKLMYLYIAGESRHALKRTHLSHKSSLFSDIQSAWEVALCLIGRKISLNGGSALPLPGRFGGRSAVVSSRRKSGPTAVCPH